MPGVLSRSAGRHDSESGATLVEFGLIFPLFLMVILGFIWFALVVLSFSNATYASRVGVRYAIVHGNLNAYQATSTKIDTLVRQVIWAAHNDVTVTSTWAPDNSTGSTVKVTVSIVVRTPIPYTSLSSITVSASSQGTILY